MSSPRRISALKAATVAAVSAAAVVGFSCEGFAQAPDVYGWWYEANSGLPVAPPPPPSVPSGGLYIENGLSGPAAISALSFAVPGGAAVGALVLQVAGTPVMSQPPVACPLTSSFQSVQEGEWSQRPSYDCQKAQVTGQVDSAMTSVTFDTSSLLDRGHVSVAILAGGPADSVAFNAPGPNSLAVTLPSSPSAVGPGGFPSGVSGGAGAPGFTSLPSSPLAIGATPGASPSAPGAAGSVARPGRGGGSGGVTKHVAAAAGRGSSLSSLAARILGLAALGLLLVAWAEGYGILGGRIKGLASPLVPSRARPAQNTEEQQVA